MRACCHAFLFAVQMEAPLGCRSLGAHLAVCLPAEDVMLTLDVLTVEVTGSQ